MPVPECCAPDELDALKALLLQCDGEVRQLLESVSTLEQALSIRMLEIEQPRRLIARSNRLKHAWKI